MSKSLLVILPHNPGDVVMALAALARIRAAYPASDLAMDYVIGEECRELAEGNPLLRRVFPLPRRALREAWSAGDPDAVLSGLEDFLASLNREPYTFSLNLFQERYGGLLQGLIRADHKAGLELAEGRLFRVGSRYLEHLFAIPASRRDNGWHAVDLYIRAAREQLEAPYPHTASPSSGPHTGFGSRPWPLPAPGGLLPALTPPPGWDGPAPGTYLAFHPGSAWPGKRWPESHWAALAEACARAGLPMVWTGAAEERDSLARIQASLTPACRAAVHLWAGRTTLTGAAWIHAGARMTVTGDTVAMHLAAAAGTPTLALFGPSNPVETGPYGPGHFILQTQADLPSDLDFGREHAGLRALPPEAVAGFVLEGRPPAGSGAVLWETAWDASRDCQVLRDRRGETHPHSRRASGLMDCLDGRNEREGGRSQDLGDERDAAVPIPGDPRNRVLEILGRCLAASALPPAADLIALEAADRNLAAATRDSLVWEAYRIALNGLSLKDIRKHLQLRMERFRLALHEEKALHPD